MGTVPEMAEMLGKIHNEDCLETMRRMPDKSVDLIVTDPPYGINADYGGVWIDTQDRLRVLVDSFVPEARRVAKVVLISCGVTGQWLYPQPDWVLGWFNNAGVGMSKWGFSVWQPLLAYGPDPYLANGKGCRPDAVAKNGKVEKFGHPFSKPINTWSWFLDRGSLFNTDIVYDPFMGSGTTAVACEKLGRRWIGSEINLDYVKIAEKRIANERAQMKMEFM